MTGVGEDSVGDGWVGESSVGDGGVLVEGLEVCLCRSGTGIVEDVSFSIASGEVLGLVGESGSGKTTVGLALLGHARRGARISAGRVQIGDADMLALDPSTRRHLLGSVASYVPQDPAACLNPAIRVGKQVVEILDAHGYGPAGDRAAHVAALMAEVALPAEAAFLDRYPHELSGGQQQRIGLAMAFACRPRLVVLDEPTTGLDVTTQAHVLDTVRRLAARYGVAALYVTHDLAVVASLAHRVAVMYGGRIVEAGSTDELFASAAHPYTRRLVAAIPRLSSGAPAGIPGRAPAPGRRPPGCSFAPRCLLAVPACAEQVPDLRAVQPGHLVRCLRPVGTVADPSVARPSLPRMHRSRPSVLRVEGLSAAYGAVAVVHGVDLELEAHRCLALVGESGSGKTTIARSIAGLHRQWSGRILLDDVALAPASRRRPSEARRRIQYVFQNPYGSLNPRRTIGQILRQPLRLRRDLPRAAADRLVSDTLELVALSPELAGHYPDQLSGGERQRVAIARALVCDPSVLICDEVTSSLDVSVQAAIMELLARLQSELGLSLLLVTHNLPLVRSIAQRVAVLKGGRIVELGAVDDVLTAPRSDDARRLVADTPSVPSTRIAAGDERDVRTAAG